MSNAAQTKSQFDGVDSYDLVRELVDRGHAPKVLADIKTTTLVDEMGDRIGDGAVLQFIDRHADHSGCLDEDDIIPLASASADELLEALAEHAWGGGDMRSADVVAAYGRMVFDAPIVRVGGLPDASLEDGALVIAAGDLAHALTQVASVIERRNTIPILGDVRVEAGAGYVTFIGTDLDIEIRTRFDLHRCVGKSFKACFQPHALLALARRLHVEALITLRVVADEGRVLVEWMGGTLTLAYRDVADFPEFHVEGAHFLKGESNGELIEAFDRLSHYISTEETRYYLNGIAISGDMGAPAAVATDGHRLYALPAALPEEIAAHRIIIPRKTIETVRRLLRGLGAFDVSVHGAEPDRICFTGPGIAVRSKLIDGKFPEWDKVVRPTLTQPRTTSIDRMALLSAVEQAIPFGPERSASVRLQAVGGRLLISASNPDVGAAKVDVGPVEGDLLDGDPVGFNGGYLRTALQQLRGERLTLRAGDVSSPCLFTTEATADGEFCILMPLRV